MRIIADVRSAKKEFSGRSARSDDGKLPDFVADVIAQVRETGDEALALLSRRFDGVELTGFEVPREQWAAGDGIDPDLQAAIGLAASRVEEFYRRQPVGGFDHATGSARLGQLVRPLERVGCYVPGGSAPLFSTLIMTAVPAKVAGVGEVVVATPPRKDGSVPPEILFAAKTVGVDRIYRLGGAQAIAALALGTATAGRVDKIVGPGNAYVVEAKRQLYGLVGIEALPGPTETLVLADHTAQPAHVAADLLAQAEHLGAQPVLITTGRELLDAVLKQVQERRRSRRRPREHGGLRGLHGGAVARDAHRGHRPLRQCAERHGLPEAHSGRADVRRDASRAGTSRCEDGPGRGAGGPRKGHRSQARLAVAKSAPQERRPGDETRRSKAARGRPYSFRERTSVRTMSPYMRSRANSPASTPCFSSFITCETPSRGTSAMRQPASRACSVMATSMP